MQVLRNVCMSYQMRANVVTNSVVFRAYLFAEYPRLSINRCKL